MIIRECEHFNKCQIYIEVRTPMTKFGVEVGRIDTLVICSEHRRELDEE